MRLSAPPQPAEDFRDRAPTVIHQIQTGGFGAGAGLAGIDYTVPANRNAVIEWTSFIVQILATIAPTGFYTFDRIYTPSGGGAITDSWGVLSEGDGPDTYGFLNVFDGQLLAGDRIQVQVSATAPTPNGSLASAIHGVEYDE